MDLRKDKGGFGHALKQQTTVLKVLQDNPSDDHFRENKAQNMEKQRLVSQIPNVDYDRKGCQERLSIYEREPMPRTI